jgi:hypothetical protein
MYKTDPKHPFRTQTLWAPGVPVTGNKNAFQNLHFHLHLLDERPEHQVFVSFVIRYFREAHDSTL